MVAAQDKPDSDSEKHSSPPSSSSSSSLSSSSPAFQQPPVVSSRSTDAPIIHSDNYIKSRLQELVEDIDLIRLGSDIESKEQISDRLHVMLWQSLLSVRENVQRIVIPVKWEDKVDPRVFPRLRVTVIRPDDA